MPVFIQCPYQRKPSREMQLFAKYKLIVSYLWWFEYSYMFIFVRKYLWFIHRFAYLYRCDVWGMLWCYLWTLLDVKQTTKWHFMIYNLKTYIWSKSTSAIKWSSFVMWEYIQTITKYTKINAQTVIFSYKKLIIKRNSLYMVNFCGISHVSPAKSKY